MRKSSNIILFLVFGLLPVLNACGQTQKKSTNTSKADSSVYSSINQQMGQIQQTFNKDSSKFSTQARQTYHQMMNLWSTMQSRGGRRMMGSRGRGMMNGGGMMGRSGMMGNGMRGNSNGMRARMMSYLGQMHQMMMQSGNSNMASMFARMRSQFGSLQPDSGSTGSYADSSKTSITGNKAIPVIEGKKLYLNTCSSCHGANANGMAGAFPPLNGSPIVAGKKDNVIKIVLGGLEGPLTVKGRHYNGMMPAFGNSFNDAQIAGIINYLRTLPKNNAGKISASDVQKIRKDISGHSGFFTAQELGIK